MKHFLAIAIVILFGMGMNSLSAQVMRNNGVVPNQPPNENEIERMKEKAEARREEYFANFINTLDADAFQKEIIRQKLDDYVEKKMEVLNRRDYDTQKERADWIKDLNETFFLDLKELISEDDYQKIQDFIAGEFDDKEIKKQKKKKKKKKKND